MSDPKYQIVVPVYLIFNKDGTKQADIPDSKNVPWTMLIEHMSNLVSGMSKQCVKEAYGDSIPEEQISDYLQGMLNLDREKLKQLFK